MNSVHQNGLFKNNMRGVYKAVTERPIAFLELIVILIMSQRPDWEL